MSKSNTRKAAKAKKFNRRILIVTIVVTAVALTILAWQYFGKEKPVKISQAVTNINSSQPAMNGSHKAASGAEEHTTPLTAMTKEEAENFVNEAIRPTWKYLRKEHPVPEVRDVISKLNSEMNAGKLLFTFQANPAPAKLGWGNSHPNLTVVASMVTDPEKDLSELIIWLPTSKVQYDYDGPERFKQTLTIKLMHEAFHYFHHTGEKISDKQAESEALWYQAQITQKMHDAGLNKIIKRADIACIAWQIWKKCKSPDDEAWQTFMRIVFGEEDKQKLCHWLPCK